MREVVLFSTTFTKKNHTGWELNLLFKYPSIYYSECMCGIRNKLRLVLCSITGNKMSKHSNWIIHSRLIYIHIRIWLWWPCATLALHAPPACLAISLLQNCLCRICAAFFASLLAAYLISILFLCNLRNLYLLILCSSFTIFFRFVFLVSYSCSIEYIENGTVLYHLVTYNFN